MRAFAIFLSVLLTCSFSGATATKYVDATGFKNPARTKTYVLPTISGSSDNLCTDTSTSTLTNKSLSGSSNTFTNIPNSATTATNANTSSAIVARDGSGNFSAGTITAALTGTASGNTTYTPNQYGVVLSGSGNAMSVLAPSSSTTMVLTAAGASSNPVWAEPAAAPSSSAQLANFAIDAVASGSAYTIAVKQQSLSDPSTGASAVKYGIRSTTATTGSYTQQSVTSALSITIPSGATMGMASGVAGYLYVYMLDYDNTPKICVSGSQIFDQGSLQTSVAIGTGSDSGNVLYCDSNYTKPVRLIGRILISEATAGTWSSEESEISLWPFHDLRGESLCVTTAEAAWPSTADNYVDLSAAITVPAGEWDFHWNANLRNSNTTTTTRLIIFIGTATGTSSAGIAVGNKIDATPVPNANTNRFSFSVPGWRTTVATATTFYLKGLASTSYSNLNIESKLCATRAR